MKSCPRYGNHGHAPGSPYGPGPCRRPPGESLLGKVLAGIMAAPFIPAILLMAFVDFVWRRLLGALDARLPRVRRALDGTGGLLVFVLVVVVLRWEAVGAVAAILDLGAVLAVVLAVVGLRYAYT